MNQVEKRTDTSPRMTEAATRLLEALDSGQREKIGFDFAEEKQRKTWAYIPLVRPGLTLGELDQSQLRLAHDLLATALSLPAYARANAIIALENVLFLLEEGDPLRARRNPANYYLAFYGKPGDATWSWRLEGHHVSVSYTVVDGQLSPTPVFLGSNPAEVRHGDTPVVRLLGQEEDLGRELYTSLRADQKERALVCESAPPDIVTRNLIDLAPPLIPEPTGPGLPEGYRFPDDMRQQLVYSDPPRGLPVAAMNEAQREKAWDVIRVYIERLPEELASAEIRRLRETGIDDVHFAWAGAEVRLQPHYYRLQGPTLVIEYDNIQNDTNHIHAVWRNPRADFGADLLARHYAQSH
jgi:hypothetical protein